MDDLRQRFGNLVAANRRLRKLSQQALADAAGVSLHLVNRIERGTAAARFPNIQKLADALQVDPAELFTPNLAAGAQERRALTNLTARLARLDDKDLEWLSVVIDAALKSR